MKRSFLRAFSLAQNPEDVISCLESLSETLDEYIYEMTDLLKELGLSDKIRMLKKKADDLYTKASPMAYFEHDSTLKHLIPTGKMGKLACETKKLGNEIREIEKAVAFHVL